MGVESAIAAVVQKIDDLECKINDFEGKKNELYDFIYSNLTNYMVELDGLEVSKEHRQKKRALLRRLEHLEAVFQKKCTQASPLQSEIAKKFGTIWYSLIEIYTHIMQTADLSKANERAMKLIDDIMEIDVGYDEDMQDRKRTLRNEVTKTTIWLVKWEQNKSLKKLVCEFYILFFQINLYECNVGMYDGCLELDFHERLAEFRRQISKDKMPQLWKDYINFEKQLRTVVASKYDELEGEIEEYVG